MAEGTFPATEAAAAGAFEAPLRAPLLAISPAAEAVSGRRLKQVEVRRLPTCAPRPLKQHFAWPLAAQRHSPPPRSMADSLLPKLLSVQCCPPRVRPVRRLQTLSRLSPALEILAIGAGFRAAPGAERGQP